MRKYFVFRGKAALVSVIFFALCIHAIGQNVGIGTTNPQGLLHVSGGNFNVTGVHNQGPTIENNVPGPRMFFYPRKGAFRAGATYTTAWDDANIGNFSIGLGMNAMAKSDFSIAIGENNIAETEPFAMAIGRSNRSAGYAALAMGHFSEATGAYSASIGLRDTVSGYGATALGGYNTVTVAFGLAAGLRNRVDGENAGAMGTDNFSPSFGEFTIGNYATKYTAQSAGGINANDRVFTIGNGQNAGNRSDAMVVLKNGNVGIGTPTPSYTFDVRGANPDENGIISSGNADLSHRLVLFGGHQNDPNPFIQWKAGDPLRFATDAGGFTEWMRINPNGNVGIGTTTPDAKLDVATSMRVLGNQGSFYVHPVFPPGASTVLLATLDGLENGPQMRFQNTAPGFMDIGLNGAGDFVVEGNDEARLAVTLSGNVGIGTATPSSKLHVIGDATVSGTISKGGGSFKIDHPLDPYNKYLYHSFVESPDMMNVYNGNITTNAQGEAVVEMPDWFEALNKEFRYQLTVIGAFAQAIIKEELKGNKFSILTDKPEVRVSWQITGIRKDQFAEENRIPVEENKKATEIGTLLYPSKAGNTYSKK
jgi:hypothetical protein